MNNLMKSLMAAGLVTVAMSANAVEYDLAPESVTAESGSVIELPVRMVNVDLDVTSLQFDLRLPDGVTVATDEYGVPSITLNPDRVADHIANGAVQTDGTVRYVCYSNNNRLFKGTDGVVMTLGLQVDAAPGTYDITIFDADLCENDTFLEYFPAAATATLTVTAPEVKRYGENQLYAKDVTINQGENAVLEVGYNSTSDVYEYTANIVMPEGVTVSDVTFAPVVAEVANFSNEWSFNAPTLSLVGEYGGGRRDLPAEGGDKIFATVSLNTASLPAGEYVIRVQDQLLSNDDDDFTPEAYEAYLKVVRNVAPVEQCATPEISINNNGHIVATCETEGATIHTTISIEDAKTVHHASGETVPLTGQYLVTSYASADGMADSETATATLAWTKSYTDPTGVQEVGTERALLIYSVGDYLCIKGTVNDEPVAVYDLGGNVLFSGKATEGTYMISEPLTKGVVYVVSIGGRNIKHMM